MTDNLCNLLFLSANLSSAQEIQGLLTEEMGSHPYQALTFQVTVVATLEQTFQLLTEQSFDLIIITVILTQESDLFPLIQIREQLPQIPILLLVENEAELLIIKAFQEGADSCLYRKTLDTPLLLHEIRLILERQNYRLRLEELQQQKRQEQEFASLEQLGASVTSITAKMYGVTPLRETAPEIFAEISQSYGKILDLALEQRAYRVDYDLSSQLREISDKLGFLRASPKDIIDLHTTTLKIKNQEVTLAKSQAYVVEGRILVLELMGYLASFYRKYYIGLSNIKMLNASE